MRIQSWLALCSLAVLVVGCQDSTEPNGDTGVTAKRAASEHVAVTELATLPGGQFSTATGINAQGDIVGWATTAAGEEHAVLWHNGQITDLGTLGGTFSEAFAINPRGQVVGIATTTGGSENPVEYAFLWQDGRMTNLGLPDGASYSVGLGINPAGVVMAYRTKRFGYLSPGKPLNPAEPAATLVSRTSFL